MSDFSTNLSTGATAAADAIAALSQRPRGNVGKVGNDGKDANDSNKVVGAARDFEALLLGQILKSAHGDGGWLGTNDDDAGEAAVGLGEEQLARSMASSGGLGLAKLIESGIRARQDAAK